MHDSSDSGERPRQRLWPVVAGTASSAIGLSGAFLGSSVLTPAAALAITLLGLALAATLAPGKAARAARLPLALIALAIGVATLLPLTSSLDPYIDQMLGRDPSSNARRATTTAAASFYVILCALALLAERLRPQRPWALALGAAAGAVALLGLLGYFYAAPVLTNAFGGGSPLAAFAFVVLGGGIVVAGMRSGTDSGPLEDDEGLERRALDALQHAVFVFDGRERRNLYVNPAYETLTGYRAEEATSAGFDAFAIFAEAQAAAAPNDPALRTPRRVTVRRRDGSSFAGKLAMSAAGPRIGTHCAVGLLEDITAEDEATRELAEQLAVASAARRDAEDANRAKDGFFAALSHELRSPLNACVMWLDVLAVAPRPDMTAKAVDALRRNLARQTRLVNDLIDAAKIASGGIELRSEPLDLIELLQRNVQAWHERARAKEIEFAWQFEPATAPIHGDAERLTQIVQRVFDNALDHTPAGGRAELRVRRNSVAFIVNIEHTGTALSPDEAASLFAPLWQSRSLAKDRRELGLTVAHHLAARHGGSLGVGSGPDAAGVLFTLSLPLAGP